MGSAESLTDRENFDSVDLFKLIGSFLVVSIHTNIFLSVSEEFNWYFVNVFSRIAVYFFFVASAYFFFRNIRFCNGKIEACPENTEKLKKYFVRVLLLYIIWSFIYMLSDIPMWYELDCLTFKNFVGFGISCIIDTSHYHLWFLISLVYAIPILYLLLRFIRIKYVIVLSILLYTIGVIYGEFSFLGLPFQETWNKFGEIAPRIQTVVFYVIPICLFAIKCDLLDFRRVYKSLLLIAAFVLYSAEGMTVHIFYSESATSYNIFMIPTVLLLFVLVKSFSISLRNNYIIRKLSTVIYCLHPLVMWGLKYIYDFRALNSILYFAVVALVTSICGLAIVLLSQKVKWLKYLM